MNWIQVLPEASLPEGAKRVVEVQGRPVLLVRHGGQVYAVDNKCPHMGAPLEKGEITAGAAIVCPRHRSVFDLASGAVKSWTPWPPGVGRVLGAMAQEKPLTTYPTRLADGHVWVGVA